MSSAKWQPFCLDLSVYMEVSGTPLIYKTLIITNVQPPLSSIVS